MCIRDRRRGVAKAHGEHGCAHQPQALLQPGAHRQPVLREGGLGAAVDDLQEQLSHGHVDGVAHQVGVERLEDGLAGQDLSGHGGGVGPEEGVYGRFRLFQQIGGSLVRQNTVSDRIQNTGVFSRPAGKISGAVRPLAGRGL